MPGAKRRKILGFPSLWAQQEHNITMTNDETENNMMVKQDAGI